MLKLTSEHDIIQSLLTRSLGESYIKFIVNTEEEGNMILEFYSKQYKFSLTRVPDEDCGDKLRIYDDGRTYLIPLFNDTDIMKNTFINSIKSFAEKLEDFYTINTQKVKEGTAFIFFKNE